MNKRKLILSKEAAEAQLKAAIQTSEVQKGLAENGLPNELELQQRKIAKLRIALKEIELKIEGNFFTRENYSNVWKIIGVIITISLFVIGWKLKQ